MRWSHLALLGTGVALGAALFRKQPLISVVHHHHNTTNVTVEAPVGPAINNETSDVDHFQSVGMDIAMLPVAEKMLLESLPLIQPYMGPERTKYVSEQVDFLARTMWIWAKKWYKHNYQESLSK